MYVLRTIRTYILYKYMHLQDSVPYAVDGTFADHLSSLVPRVTPRLFRCLLGRRGRGRGLKWLAESQMTASQKPKKIGVGRRDRKRATGNGASSEPAASQQPSIINPKLKDQKSSIDSLHTAINFRGSGVQYLRTYSPIVESVRTCTYCAS